MPRADSGGFDEVSECYDETIPAHITRHYVEKRVRFFRGVFPGRARLLDVGCGTGRLAAALREAGFRVTGTDASHGMLSRAASRGLLVALGGVDALPFRDGAFDGAYSVAVMHHLRMPALVRACTREMLRVIRRDGRIVIWDHNPLNPYWPLFMRRLPQDRGDERLVGWPELAASVADGGGRVVSHERLGFVPDFIPSALLAPLSRLEGSLERIPVIRAFAAHNVIVAAKNEA